MHSGTPKTSVLIIHALNTVAKLLNKITGSSTYLLIINDSHKTSVNQVLKFKKVLGLEKSSEPNFKGITQKITLL